MDLTAEQPKCFDFDPLDSVSPLGGAGGPLCSPRRAKMIPVTPGADRVT